MAQSADTLSLYGIEFEQNEGFVLVWILPVTARLTLRSDIRWAFGDAWISHRGGAYFFESGARHREYGTNVYLRKVASQDQTEFLQLMRASMDIHRPWITPPTTPQMFRNYLQRIRRSDHEGYAICRTDDDRIVGVININHIVRGTFQNASLGYYVGEPYQGHGYMQQGLEQLPDLRLPPWACTVWRRTARQCPLKSLGRKLRIRL